MANLPEDGSSFPSGVYQLETTDPVQGGVSGKSNAPLINLTNRTAWLKNRVDSLLAFMTGSRTRLSGSRTWYVSTAGNDSNDGSANDAGHAFRTIQRAIDVVTQSVDCNGYQPTIKVADGTYVGAIVSGPLVGASAPLIIEGNVTTPANAIVSATAGSAFTILNSAQVQIQGFAVSATGTGTGQGCGVLASLGATVSFNKIAFGSCDTAQIYASLASVSALPSAAYSISGTTPAHMRAGVAGDVNVVGATITLVGGPTWSVAYAVAQGPCLVQTFSNTVSGTSTGPRYLASLNGVISVNGGGSSALPGSTAGSTDTGGQYA